MEVNAVLTQDMPAKMQNFYDQNGVEIKFPTKVEHRQAITRDLAVLVLATEVQGIVPLDLVPIGFSLEQIKQGYVGLVGYPADREIGDSSGYPLPIANFMTCDVGWEGNDRKILRTNCVVAPRSSGGPLLVEISNKRYLIGTMSSSEAKPSFFVSILDPTVHMWLSNLILGTHK